LELSETLSCVHIMNTIDHKRQSQDTATSIRNVVKLLFSS
jgi:hypothetical protein